MTHKIVHYGMEKESTPGTAVPPYYSLPYTKDDSITSLREKILKSFYISPLELGVVQATMGHTFSSNIPISSTWQPDMWEQAAVDIPVSPLPLVDADYANRRDMFTRMEKGETWEYAECMWLENLVEQYAQGDLDKTFPGGIQVWTRYALMHCPRYRAAQPRYIQAMVHDA